MTTGDSWVSTEGAVEDFRNRSACRSMCSARILVATAEAARSFNCWVNCCMRCQGTNSAAAMISTTAAPNSSWHLTAREILRWRRPLNIVTAYLTGKEAELQGWRQAGYCEKPSRSGYQGHPDSRGRQNLSIVRPAARMICQIVSRRLGSSQ